LHTPPSPPFLFLSLFAYFFFCFSFISFSLFLFSLFHSFSFSLSFSFSFSFFLYFSFSLSGLRSLVILKLRSATFWRSKIYILYLDFCSYLKKTKKNQEIVNSESSSKTPILQSSKKLTKLPLLQTSKNRRNCWKKSCSIFLTFLFFFEFFSENVFKILLRGLEITRKQYWMVFEKFTFLDKNLKKSLKKKIIRFFLTNLIFCIFSDFFSENVFKTLLRGREITRKKYLIVFEKFLFCDKKSKKSRKKKVVRNLLTFFFSSFSQKMSSKLL